MKKRRYTVLLERENGTYHAYCPAFPNCRSYGDTKKEAIRNIEISICYRLETLVAKGRPFPRDGDPALRSETQGRECFPRRPRSPAQGGAWHRAAQTPAGAGGCPRASRRSVERRHGWNRG